MLEARSQGKEVKMNKFLLVVPAFCDFVSSMLNCIALNFIAGSVYQMIRGGTIITTFIFSIIILKSKVKKNQSLGAVLAFLGVLIVGASNLFFSDKESGSTDVVIIFFNLGSPDYGLCFAVLFTHLFWALHDFLAETVHEILSRASGSCWI